MIKKVYLRLLRVYHANLQSFKFDDLIKSNYLYDMSLSLMSLDYKFLYCCTKLKQKKYQKLSITVMPFKILSLYPLVILILLRHEPHASQTGEQQQSTIVANTFWQQPRQMVKSLIAGV